MSWPSRLPAGVSSVGWVPAVPLKLMPSKWSIFRPSMVTPPFSARSSVIVISRVDLPCLGSSPVCLAFSHAAKTVILSFCGTRPSPRMAMKALFFGRSSAGKTAGSNTGLGGYTKGSFLRPQRLTWSLCSCLKCSTSSARVQSLGTRSLSQQECLSGYAAVRSSLRLDSLILPVSSKSSGPSSLRSGSTILTRWVFFTGSSGSNEVKLLTARPICRFRKSPIGFSWTILNSSRITRPVTAAVVVAMAGMIFPATSLALLKSVGGIA
mmetsp:Transcript_40699/g.91497  ORF Transcript_40699/g.91497 Transcript_40699/m.91497 type:complete len:266 (+) Transcript_40699:363-1160(+)